jgi:hypothetical protein
VSEGSLIQQEKQTASAMMEIFCSSFHVACGDDLCRECGQLLEYSHQRLESCRFGEDKPSCRTCPVHCYAPEKREKMREVMRFSGPKMIFRHPWLALRHLWLERVTRRRPAPGAKGKPLS